MRGVAIGWRYAAGSETSLRRVAAPQIGRSGGFSGLADPLPGASRGRSARRDHACRAATDARQCLRTGSGCQRPLGPQDGSHAARQRPPTPFCPLSGRVLLLCQPHRRMTASSPETNPPVRARRASRGTNEDDRTHGRLAPAMVAPVFMPSILAEARSQQIHLPALFRGLQIDAADFEVPGTLISHRDAIAVVGRTVQLPSMAERGLEA
eukprot:gene59307-79137_t